MSAKTGTAGKKGNTSIYLIICGVVIVLAGAAFLVNKKYHLWEKFFKTKASQVTVQDVDSLQMIKKEEIKKFVIEFLTTVKSDESLNKYYADEVQRCYLKENLTLYDVIKEKNYYKKTHPRAKVILNPSTININLKDEETTEVFANADYFSDSLGVSSKQIVYHLKINKDTKVFYINNPEQGQ